MSDSRLDEIKNKIIKQHEGDEKQLEVIFSNEPRIIVEAPAGYGKTTTMISRIAYLYATGQIPNPKKVLGLTFSVNAALKVKREVAEKLPLYINAANNPISVESKVSVTNFHGFCKGVLRKHGFLLSEYLRNDINRMKAFGRNAMEKDNEIKRILGYDDHRFLIETEKQIETSHVPSVEAIDHYNRIVLDKLVPRDIITHDAVILLTINLFSNYPNIKKFYSNYYPLIVVDEFQDTNCIAWVLLNNLISEHSQLLFLGDPLQRIYGFIGAVPNIMAVAEKQLAMKHIALNKNYRFRNNKEMLLLDSNIRANAAANLKPEKLETANIPAFWGEDQKKESEAVAKKILDLKNKTNSRIVILFRSRNDNAAVFEQTISESEIDYFYGMYTDEDQVYIDFHNYCITIFVSRFGKNHSVTNRQLKSFADTVKLSFLSKDQKAVSSLCALLYAFIKKVNTDYSELQPEEKYELVLDVFENRQLKQAMEYVESDLILATIHGAKGLEWDYVFIPDLERYLMPAYTCGECSNKYATPIRCKCCLPKDISPIILDKLLDELSVFYVAVTRARKQAFVSASRTKANEKDSAYSCFTTLEGINLVNGANID